MVAANVFAHIYLFIGNIVWIVNLPCSTDSDSVPIWFPIYKMLLYTFTRIFEGQYLLLWFSSCKLMQILKGIHASALFASNGMHVICFYADFFFSLLMSLSNIVDRFLYTRTVWMRSDRWPTYRWNGSYWKMGKWSYSDVRQRYDRKHWVMTIHGSSLSPWQYPYEHLQRNVQSTWTTKWIYKSNDFH